MRELLVAVLAAHAALVGGEPVDGAELHTAPSTVVLRFTEPVTRADVSVTAPDGTIVDAVPPEVVDATVTLAINAPEMRGEWTIAYRVVSLDGHPVTGESSFTTTSGMQVERAATRSVDTFLHRHQTHLIWAGIAALLGLGLLVGPLLRRRP